jgi:hypothetical protein
VVIYFTRTSNIFPAGTDRPTKVSCTIVDLWADIYFWDLPINMQERPSSEGAAQRLAFLLRIRETRFQTSDQWQIILICVWFLSMHPRKCQDSAVGGANPCVWGPLELEDQGVVDKEACTVHTTNIISQLQFFAACFLISCVDNVFWFT